MKLVNISTTFRLCIPNRNGEDGARVRAFDFPRVLHAFIVILPPLWASLNAPPDCNEDKRKWKQIKSGIRAIYVWIDVQMTNVTKSTGGNSIGMVEKRNHSCQPSIILGSATSQTQSLNRITWNRRMYILSEHVRRSFFHRVAPSYFWKIVIWNGCHWKSFSLYCEQQIENVFYNFNGASFKSTSFCTGFLINL